MNIKIDDVSTSTESLIRQFSVSVPNEEMMTRLDKAVKELAPKVELKGFRKGHVPESHVRQVHGEEILRNLLEEVIDETSRDALKDKDLELALAPRANLESEPKDILEGANLRYKIIVELQPKFDLMDITNLELEKTTTEVKDGHITEALNDIAARNPLFEEGESGAPAKNDDLVLLDIVGTIDGAPFENNESKDMKVHLGKGHLQENIEKVVLGKNADDIFNVPMGFPADHPNKTLAGKLADFSVHLKSVKAQRAPVIDETLAKSFGATSVEDLRQKIRSEMERADETTAQNQMKQQISEKLAEGHNFDLPPSLLEQEKGALMNQINAMQQQLSPAEQQKAQAQMGQVEKNISEMAKKRVKIALVLSRVAKNKKLDVTNDELKAAVEADIRSYGAEGEKVQKLYQENPQFAQRLYAQILEEKTLDSIVETAKIKAKAVERNELYKQVEAENNPQGKQSLTDSSA